MKALVILLLLMLITVSVNTRKALRPMDPEKKIFIITLDGFRWEEVFNGADSALMHDSKNLQDAGLAREMFWTSSVTDRRKKLLPFLWNMVGVRGQVYGNRKKGNHVNVANPYGLSYPGYSELLTGKVDLSIYNNSKTVNNNPNLLDRLNNDIAYEGKVAAFTSWDVFPFILDKKKGSFVLNSGHQNVEGKLSDNENYLNEVQSAVAEKKETRYDELTYIACREYVMRKKPSVVFLSFSGTDNAGHDGKYNQYLREANNADRMIGDLWRLVQSMPEYAGKTTFLITTDHGRGNRADNWHKHGFFVPGSTTTWMALLGPSIVPLGEMQLKKQIYQKNISDLVFELLGR
jgi:hypothetical protein